MRFTVEGADALTGTERIVQIEASSKAEAETKARQGGILISEIHAAVVQPDAAARIDIVLDERFEHPGDDVGFTAPAPTPVAYRTPATTAAHRLPEYLGLKIGSSVLLVFAIIYYIACICLTVIGLLTVATGIEQNAVAVGSVGGFFFVVWGLTAGMAGAMMHAMSAGCVALRDMSRHIQARL